MQRFGKFGEDNLKSGNPFAIYLRKEQAENVKSIKILPSQVDNLYDKVDAMEGGDYKKVLDLLKSLSKFLNAVIPHNNAKTDNKIIDLLNEMGGQLTDFASHASDEMSQAAKSYSTQCITDVLDEMKKNQDKLHTVFITHKNFLRDYLEANKPRSQQHPL